MLLGLLARLLFILRQFGFFLRPVTFKTVHDRASKMTKNDGFFFKNRQNLIDKMTYFDVVMTSYC